MKFVIIAVLLACAVIWLKSRISLKGQRQSMGAEPKRKLGKKKRSSTTARHYPYHAVSIRHETNACLSVLGVGKRRFLPVEAPSIPLPECNSPHGSESSPLGYWQTVEVWKVELSSLAFVTQGKVCL
jgi:hypothetical protein